jgi:hypothetical protein
MDVAKSQEAVETLLNRHNLGEHKHKLFYRNAKRLLGI